MAGITLRNLIYLGSLFNKIHPTQLGKGDHAVFKGNMPCTPKSLSDKLVLSPSLCLISVPESAASDLKQQRSYYCRSERSEFHCIVTVIQS